jgi:signal transduction histidine kinase
LSSIQRGLQLSLLAGAGTLLALLLWGGGELARRLGEDFIANRLVHDGESLLAALDLTDPAQPLLDPRLANPVFRRPLSGHYYLVLAGAQTLRSPSLWDSDFSAPAQAVGNTARSYRDGPNQQRLLLLSAGFRKQGQTVTVVVAEDIAPLLTDISLFRWAFGALALLLIAASALLQFVIVRRAFRRLDRVRGDLRRLAQGELDSLPEDAPQELQPLVAEINRLLTLLGQRIERSRRSLGDLAHALKTPLNLQLQLLRGEALADRPEPRDQLLTQASRIEALMSRELRRAQLAGTATPGRHFDVARELPDLIASVAMMHAARRLDMQLDNQLSQPLALDREDMLELLGNLLDNAAKWARQRVLCRAWLAGDGSVNFSVEDDGPGVAENDLAQLAQRGLRLDERVAGHGLGLSIAADIAALYGGTLSFERAPELGGLRACLRFPPRAG